MSISSSSSSSISNDRHREELDRHNTEHSLHSGRFGFYDGLGIVIGIIIGSGIFSSPGVALKRAGSAGLSLIAWTFSGCLVGLTSTCYLELASLYPKAGGDYEYLTRAYGDRAGFSFAWFNFWISKTGSQAIIATIFGRYFERVVILLYMMCNGGSESDSLKKASSVDSSASALSPDHDEESIFSKTTAITGIVFITILNCLSVKESSIIQNVLTASKLILVIQLFVAALVYYLFATSNDDNEGEGYGTVDSTTLSSSEQSFQGSTDIFGFSTALVACLWSFDGWADLNFMMEELAQPSGLPRIVLTAIFTVTSAYILCNIAYFLVLPLDTMTDSRAIGTDFGIAISNGQSVAFWPIFIAFGVVISTAGSLNGSIMTGARAFYAVARDGKFPKQLSRVNMAGSPYGALIAQGMWTIVLLLLPGSSFSTLLDYFGPASWFFYAFTSSSVIWLRRKEESKYLERSFKVPFYPLPVVAVIIIAAFIITCSIIRSPFYVLLAFGFVALSVPAHYWFFERK